MLLHRGLVALQKCERVAHPVQGLVIDMPMLVVCR